MVALLLFSVKGKNLTGVILYITKKKKKKACYNLGSL